MCQLFYWEEIVNEIHVHNDTDILEFGLTSITSCYSQNNYLLWFYSISHITAASEFIYHSRVFLTIRQHDYYEIWDNFYA